MKREILSEIQSLHNGTIKYSGGVLHRYEKKLELMFVTNVAPSDSLSSDIKQVVKKYLPSSIDEIEIIIKKVVTTDEFVIKSVLDYFASNFISCADCVDKSRISVEKSNNFITLKISVEQTHYNYLISKRADQSLKEYLEKNYIESFIVEFVDGGRVEADLTKLELKIKENEIHKSVIRTLTVSDVTRLFDNDSNPIASYIVDTKDYLGEVYLAGVITSIRELKTKNDKPYFIIDFNDRTASASGTIFPNKADVSKVQRLEQGSEIIVRGEYEMRGGYHNLRIKSINLCIFPKNFVPVARPKRPVPNEYSLIEPKEIVIESQSSFIDDLSVPACFNGRTFVVFDLETTGTLDSDKIIEIGAVKIENGKIVSYFETLVNPSKRITSEITEITGITNEMVADAPDFSQVVGDFYKYCYGSTMVAHNIEFDSRFIRRQSREFDFVFDNPEMDTLQLARECIYGVSNYKLNTLCDKFGISFNHHRAYSDALACAKLFIEIIRIRKDFPF